MASEKKEFFEEKPHYETEEDKTNNEPLPINSQIDVFPSSKKCEVNCDCCYDCCCDEDACCCSSHFILVYLFRAIINVSALVLSYYLKYLMENKKPGEYEDFPYIFGLTGGIGSFIILIYASVTFFEFGDVPTFVDYIVLLVFACFWVCLYGFISVVSGGIMCLSIAIMAAIDIGNILINSIGKISKIPVLVVFDLIMIGTGIGLYAYFIGEFEKWFNIVNFVFRGVWLIGKWIIYYVLYKKLDEFDDVECKDAAHYVLSYFACWFMGIMMILYVTLRILYCILRTFGDRD